MVADQRDFDERVENGHRMHLFNQWIGATTENHNAIMPASSMESDSVQLGSVCCVCNCKTNLAGRSNLLRKG